MLIVGGCCWMMVYGILCVFGMDVVEWVFFGGFNDVYWSVWEFGFVVGWV